RAGAGKISRAAAGIVGADGFGPIGFGAIDRREDRDEVGDVAEAEIEALRADGREGVGRLTYEDRAVLAGVLDAEDAQGEDEARRGEGNRAEEILRFLAEGGEERIGAARLGFAEHLLFVDPDEVGAIAAGG